MVTPRYRRHDCDVIKYLGETTLVFTLRCPLRIYKYIMFEGPEHTMQSLIITDSFTASFDINSSFFSVLRNV